MNKRVLSTEEKALLQAKHRMEEAQAREREKAPTPDPGAPEPEDRAAQP